MTQPALLSPYPTGWYCLALADELRPGDVKALTFAGREIVLFRGTSGRAVAMDAYCPHLGAHMGRGGKVKGNALECPFHGFQFDEAGRCIANAYKTDPPKLATVETLELRELNGVVLAWHDDEGRAPDWEVPTLDQHGWRPLRARTMELKSHPQETTENSVDLGHLSFVHGYKSVENIEQIRTEGSYLTLSYQMQRKNPFGIGHKFITSRFKIHVHGLGFSLVEIHVVEMNFRFRLLILPTPMRDGRITLRAAVAMKELDNAGDIHPLARLAPRWLLQELIHRATLRGIAHDVGQDFEVWENKIYVDPPILARGDGPIGRYRRWCRQFYPEQRAKLEKRAAG